MRAADTEFEPDHPASFQYDQGCLIAELDSPRSHTLRDSTKAADEGPSDVKARLLSNHQERTR